MFLSILAQVNKLLKPSLIVVLVECSLTRKTLEEPIKALNVDSTKNKKGTIKSYVDLEFQIGHKKFEEQFYVTGLGKQKIILGFPWLNKYNLIIDWKRGEIKWQPLKIN